VDNEIFGTHKILPDKMDVFEIGSLSLVVARYENEWKIATRYDLDPLKNQFSSHSKPNIDEDLFHEFEVNRFTTSDKSNDLMIQPLLSDLPVVARPDHPFFVTQKSEATLYISTPLWIQINEDKKPEPLIELPTFRLSDTWFGADSIKGEFCYAVRTAAQLRLKELPIRRHRAVTSVRIKNSTNVPMSIDRLKLPLENLNLYINKENQRLQTDDIIFEKKSEDKVEKTVRSPKDKSHLTKIKGPREPYSEKSVIKTFGSFFS
jgi:hypothetical protein